MSLSRSRSLAQSRGPLDLADGTATQLRGRAAAANDLWALVALLSSARVSVNAPLREAGGLAGEHTVLLMACLRKQSDLAKWMWLGVVVTFLVKFRDHKSHMDS